VAPDTHDVTSIAIAAVAAGTTGVLLAASGGLELPAAAIAGVALIAVGVGWPGLFLMVFLLTRPLVAAISNDQLVHGVASGNADGAIAVLLLLITGIALMSRRAPLIPPITAPFVLVLIISGVCAVYAFATLGGVVGTDPISEMFRLGAELAVFLLAANQVTDATGAERVFVLVGLSAVVPAVIGVVQWIEGPAFVASLGVARISSTFGGGPNEFAAYMAVCAVLLLGLPKRLPVWIQVPALSVILLALIGTYSREGWIMFLIGIVLIGWRRRRGLVLAAAVLAVGVVIAVPAVRSRVLPSATTNAPSGQTAQTYASFSWRLDTWRILFDKYLQSPVIGYGLRSTIYVNPRRTTDAGGPSSGFAAHNSFIQILIEGGVVLLIPYLLLLGSIIRRCLSLARDRQEPAALAALGSLLLSLWAIVLIAGLTADDTLGETTLMYAMFALLGALEGARRKARSQAPAFEKRSPDTGVHDG